MPATVPAGSTSGFLFRIVGDVIAVLPAPSGFPAGFFICPATPRPPPYICIKNPPSMQNLISQTFAISAQRETVSIDHTDNYYMRTASLETPSASDSRWYYVPVGGEAYKPTAALPYLWHKSITYLTDGTALPPVIEFGGSLGQNGIDYDLVPSHSSILKAEDGTLSPIQVSCALIRREADGSATAHTTLPSGYSIQVVKDITASSYSLGQDISTADCSVISFVLKYGDVEIERHDIRVIAEGSEGLAGRGIQSQDYRFLANSDGTMPTAPTNNTEWNRWAQLSASGYSSENKYLWRCCKTVYVDGNGNTDTTYVVDGPTVWGTDGKDAIFLDLDNEMDAIPADAEGKALSEVTLTTNLRLYKGSSHITSGIDAPAPAGIMLAGIRPSVNNTSGVITIQWTIPAGTSLSSLRYAVAIPVIYDNRTFSVTFTANIVRSGEPGVSPTIYQLLLSETEVSFSRNASNVLTPSSYSIFCGYTKNYEGNIQSFRGDQLSHLQNIDGKYYIFFRPIKSDGSYDGNYTRMSSLSSYGYALVIASSVTWTAIEFILTTASSYNGITSSNIIDRETLPINKDGINGAKGDSAFIIDLDNEMDGVSVLSSGIAASSQSLRVNAKAIYGHTDVTTDSATTFTIAAIEGNTSSNLVRLTNSSGSVVTTNSTLPSGILNIASANGAWTRSGVVRITIQASHTTYGLSTAIFTLKPIFPGEDGKPVPVYNLLLSETEASFSRNSSNVLTPASIKINCGYTKTDANGPKSYPGTDRNNLWTAGGAPYNIFYRSLSVNASSEITYGPWEWMKDLTAANSYALVIQSSTSYIAYEFILSSATGVSSIADYNIIDRETLPIRIAAATGNGISVDDFYYCLTKTMVQPSTSSLTTDNGWYKQGTTGCPTAPTQMQPFLWQCEHIEYSSTTSLNKNIVKLVSVYNMEQQPNLLEQTAFDSENVMDKWFVRNGEVIPQARGSFNAYGCFPNASSYREMLNQMVYQPGYIAKIEPSQWYTLSFYSRTRRMVNLTSKDYVFGTQEIYLKVGTYKLQINGHCSSEARSADTPVSLRVYLYGPKGSSSGSSWDIAVHAKITTTVDSSALSETLNVTTAGIYQISFYAYKAENTGGDDGETVTINWWRVLSLSDNSLFRTFLYPSALYSGSTYFVDGVVKSSLPSDGRVDWNPDTDDNNADSGGWTRHYVTFQTKAEITEVTQQLLFRIYNTYVEICQPKLEKSVLPTPWCEHEYDIDTECSNNFRKEWKANTAYYFCDGVRDVVKATASANGGTSLFRLKRRTSAAGYSSNIQPYLDTEHWAKANHMDFTATDLLLAKEVFTDKLTVTKVQGANGKFTLDEEGKVTGTDCTFNGGSFNDINVSGNVNGSDCTFNGGSFNNINVFGKGTFKGFVGSEMIYITSSNIKDYMKYDDDLAYLVYMDIEKMGNFIWFQSLGEFIRIPIYLPSIYPGTSPSEDVKKKAREMVGQTIYIFNQTSEEIAISTYSPISGVPGDSSTSFLIEHGQVAILSCKMGFANGTECVYWTREIGNYV